jgi:hypothetical protein
MLPFGSPEESVKQARERHLERYLEAQRLKQESEERRKTRRLFRKSRKLSRKKRRLYLVIALNLEILTVLVVWNTFGRTLDDSSFGSIDSFIILFVAGTGFNLLSSVQQSTYVAQRTGANPLRRPRELRVFLRDPVAMSVYRTSVTLASFLLFTLALARIYSNDNLGHGLTDSPRVVGSVAFAVAFVLLDIPTAYIGWTEPDGASPDEMRSRDVRS